jgi:hypothetical protein
MKQAESYAFVPVSTRLDDLVNAGVDQNVLVLRKQAVRWCNAIWGFAYMLLCQVYHLFVDNVLKSLLLLRSKWEWFQYTLRNGISKVRGE